MKGRKTKTPLLPPRCTAMYVRYSHALQEKGEEQKKIPLSLLPLPDLIPSIFFCGGGGVAEVVTSPFATCRDTHLYSLFEENMRLLM